MKRRRLSAALTMVATLMGALPVRAADPLPKAVAQAVVWVACDNRQGTGTVINGEEGHVLTNAHVAIDIKTQTPAPQCVVGFTDGQGSPPIYHYQAMVERYVFDQSRNQDFAILKIGNVMSRIVLPKPFPFLKTNEFPALGQKVRMLGYSDRETDTVVDREGEVTRIRGGWIRINAPIRSGDSGGAVIDANHALMGMPTASLTVTSGTQVLEVSSEVVDVRAVINWLDTAGKNVHDQYLTHIDYPRYHENAIYQEQTDLGCDDLVRTPEDPAVYCMILGDRFVFPNAATYFSWFSDFSKVIIIDPSSLKDYPIKRNVTYRPGTLVKSESAPDVYVVVDTYGTMRGIPTEAKAVTLFGADWASKVKVIPEAFFVNYSIGQPLEA